MAIVKIVIEDTDDGVQISTELDASIENKENATPAHFVLDEILKWIEETDAKFKQKETE